MIGPRTMELVKSAYSSAKTSQKKTRDFPSPSFCAAFVEALHSTLPSTARKRKAMIALFVIALAILGLCLAESEKFYALVIDAGSTGSRGFVFEFGVDQHGGRTVASMKGKKVTPGLSSFVDHPADAIDYLMPTFLDAAQIIPKTHHMATTVYIKGTAGMRLLSVDDQTKLWDVLYDGLDNSPQMPFIVRRENFGTIDGYFEAYYAVLASNYVAGSINGNLRRIQGKEMVGALDMGGSSTQLIFHTGTEINKPVRDSDFWSHSWLNYGVEKVREKVWKHLVKRNGKAGAKNGAAVMVENPCTFVGHLHEWDETFTLVGTGEGTKCVEVIKKVLWPEGQCATAPCYVDGVEHPRLQGEFYAMSVYFYAIDCIRQHGKVDLPGWPNPTIDEIEDAVHQFCALDWPHAQEHMLGAGKKHPYTEDSQLSHRCLEGIYMITSPHHPLTQPHTLLPFLNLIFNLTHGPWSGLYMATLLEHAFGFDGTHRNITLALEIRGNEVEWTLGYALAEIPFPAPLDSAMYKHELWKEEIPVKTTNKVPSVVETKTTKKENKQQNKKEQQINNVSGNNGSVLLENFRAIFRSIRSHFQSIFNVAYCFGLLYAYLNFQ